EGVMRLMKSGIAIVFAVALLTAPAPARVKAQEAARIGASPLTHVGMVVPNVDKAIQQYVKVMGFAPPKPATYPLDLPNGQKAEVKLAYLYMPNFHMELIEPVSKVGPFYDHLQKYGMSIEHLGYEVAGSIDDVRAGLEQKGGKWVLGSKGTI